MPRRLLIAGACCTIVSFAAGATSAIVSQQSATADRARTNWMRRYDRAASFDVEYVPNVMVPMRDGVALATALYFPAQNGKRADGPFPVLLTRHMGDSSASGGKNLTARYFASRGYVVADQTMRGRFRSGGDSFYLYGRQQFDGADAVEWLASQPWSTGKVGTYGVSHAGVAQYSLATQKPKGLAAMVPAFAQSNSRRR